MNCLLLTFFLDPSSSLFLCIGGALLIVFFINTVITQMPNLNPNYCICLAGKYSEVCMYCGTYQYTIDFAICSGWKFAAHIYASWSPIFL